MSSEETIVRKQRVRGILLAVGTSILSKGGNILLMLLAIPIAYRVLGEERAAIYGVMQSLMWLVSMADLGTGTGMVRRLACAVADGDRVRQRQIVATAFLITSLFALTGLLLLSALFTWVPVPSLFGKAFAPYADEVLQTAWVSMGIFLTLMVLGCMERVREGFQEVHVGNVFGSVYNVSAALLLWLGISYFPSPMFMVVAIYGILIFFSAANATAVFWKRRWLLPSFRMIDRGLLRSMTGEGMGLFFAGSVAPIVIREAPKFMLGEASDVAHYWILVQLGLIGMGFILMITRPLWPAMADAASRRDYAWIVNARRQMVRHFLPCAVIGVCAFSLIGPGFTSWWLKTQCGLTGLQFVGYGLVFAFTAWSHLHYVMLGSIGMSGVAAKVLLSEAALTVVLTWWGIQSYGLTGAIYASAIGMVTVSAWLLPVFLGRALREKSAGEVVEPVAAPTVATA